MKKILVTLMVALGLFTTQAASVATLSVTGAATNSVLTSGAAIGTLTIGNAGTNTLTLVLFDSGSSALTYSHSGYTVYSNYTGNVTNTVVSSTGTTNTFIYTDVILRATNTIGAATNSFVKLGTYMVPAGETLVVPYSPPLVGIRGITATNTAPGGTATLTLNYTSYK